MSFQVSGRIPFTLSSKLKAICSAVLGPQYDLSVAFLSPEKMRAVTLRTKKRNKVSNVLSFPLSKQSGEILLCLAAAAPYATEYLFIHGVLHLKGLSHGVTMEREERRLLARFGFKCKKSLLASTSARTKSRLS